MLLPFVITLAAITQMQTPVPAESKQFDFWIGEWTCSGESIGPDGKKSPTEGVNTIKRSFGGHVVEENFRMGQFHGMSMSVYDTKAKLWRQTWVDNQGSYIALTGEYRNGKMILTTIPKPKAPKSANRMVFYNIRPESFDWDWESTADGGKTWKLQWRLNYKRSKS